MGGNGALHNSIPGNIALHIEEWRSEEELERAAGRKRSASCCAARFHWGEPCGVYGCTPTCKRVVLGKVQDPLPLPIIFSTTPQRVRNPALGRRVDGGEGTQSRPRRWLTTTIAIPTFRASWN